MSAALPKYAFRADIEGLRALAVLAVVAGHVAPSVLPGGFCGVDVFFVISGYLIGKHLLQDLQAGQFSFLRFYARRARRILPALVVVLLGVWGAGWMMLSAPELAALGQHIAAAAVFSNNILLWSQAGYFDAAATTKPLLHLWSLGVEEQFYLLVPLLLWLGARARQVSIRWVLRAGVVSLLIEVLRNQPTFYLLDERFWELGVGVAIGYLALRSRALAAGAAKLTRERRWESLACILALMFVAATLLGAQLGQASPRAPGSTLGLLVIFLSGIGALQLVSLTRRPTAWHRLMAACQARAPQLRLLAASLGLVLICTSLLVMGSADWPGPQTLFPVLGTALCIAAGADSPVNRLLATRPLVFIGGISYPLYLWHWPAIVFWRLSGIDGRPASLAIPVAAAVLLAWATRELIENPLRFGRLGAIALPAMPVWMVAVALALAAVLGVSAVARAGYPDRFSPSLSRLAAWPEPDPDRPWRVNLCYFYPGVRRPFAPECTPARRPGTAQLLLWGDSHAADLYPGLVDLQARDGFAVAQWTAAGCPPTRIALVREQPGCAERRAAALSDLARVAPDTVLVAGAWEIYLANGASSESILAATRDVLGWLHESGVRHIVLFGPGPTWNATLPIDLFRYMSLRRTEQLPERLGWVPQEVRRMDSAMAAQARAAGAEYVSLLGRLCDARGCRTQVHTGQVPPDLLFRDHDHLTISGSRFLIGAAACQIFAATGCPQGR
ncbi:MAG TPA: acyltransferase family protein [Steroidobacteraceae bacterium]|nr:acyltransferase family protein [Steroidobacteraceae bacterium]